MSRKLKRNFELTEKNKTAIRTNVTKIDMKWLEVYRTKGKFLKKFGGWLKHFVVSADEQVQVLEPSLESTNRGRHLLRRE